MTDECTDRLETSGSILCKLLLRQEQSHASTWSYLLFTVLAAITYELRAHQQSGRILRVAHGP